VYSPPHAVTHTLILDLDETLIHCNENLSLPHDVTLKIKFPTGEKIDAGVNVRPFAIDLLRELSQKCEIIVFTASHECYANVVLDHLDPKREFISHRLFRSQCWQTE
jgi:CTD small phosphatase-like protein 2